MFYTWLLAQRERTDDVGRFALHATQDKQFPRTTRLAKLLLYCNAPPERRRAAKRAHREWRGVR